MNNRALFLAALVTLFAQLSFGQECDPAMIESCIGEMKALYSNQDSPIIVKNENELKTLCSHQQRALTCINNFVDRCLSDKHRSLYNNLTGGVQEFISEFCMENSNTRKIYIKHLTCFNKVADKVHHCSIKLSEWQKTSQDKAQDRETYLKETCCHFGQAMTCMTTVVQDGCPDEAYQLFSGMVTKISTQFTKVAQCDANFMTATAECSSASWTQLSFGLFLISMLFSILRRS